MDVFALNLRLKEEGASSVDAAVKKLRRSFDDAGKGASNLDKAFAGLKGKLIGLASVATVATIFKKIAEESSQAQFAQAQLQAAMQSTGNAAGMSLQQLNDHASALQRVSTFGDDAVTSAQGVLMTFTRINSQQVFQKATNSVVDLATALQMDLPGAARIVGKALNDPANASRALMAANIRLTDEQTNLIKSFTDVNDVASAQAIILQELETRYKGSAEAARNTLGGALAALKNSFGDLFEVSNEGSKGIVSLINLIIDWMDQHKGAIDRFVGDFSLGLVVVIAEIAKFKNRLEMAMVNIPAFFMNVLRPLQYLPVIGGQVKAVLDGWNTALRQSYDASAKDRKGWEEWKITKIRAIMETDAAAKKLTPPKPFGAGGGGTGAAGTVTAPPPMGQMPGIGIAQRVMPPELSAISAGALEKVKASTQSFTDEARIAFYEQITMLANEMNVKIRDTFVDALANGISAAIETGSIGEGFKALGATLLAGLGGMMIEFGKSLIPVAALMKKVRDALLTMNPIGILAAAAGFIAVGAMLRGAAQRSFGGGAGAGGGGFGTSLGIGGGAVGGSGALRFVPTMAGQAGQMQPRGAVTVNATIIGPNDPAAQRQIADVVNNAARRGLVRGADMRTA